MKLLAKVGSLALIAAVAGGVVAGCSSNDVTKQGTAKGSEGPTGTVGLSLQPVSGVTLNTIHFVVTQAGSATPISEGDLPTPGTAKTFSFGLPLAVGTGYTISLSGTSVEHATTTCVGSFGPFNVTANASTALTMTLVCTDASQGNVKGGVTVTTDACPRLSLDFVVATPSSQDVGKAIAVAGSAHDLDGKTIAYSWTASVPAAGTFAPANAATSSFSCATGANNFDVVLKASNGECSKSLAATVSCLNVLCGNGVNDPGEPCDPSVAGTTNCLANCTLAVCGNGIVETPVETCDPVPADINNCDATCHTRPKLCGDGFKEAGEACDPSVPGTTNCNPDCTPQAVALCGDGVVTAPEICDPKFTVNNCGSDCLAITSATCLTCENATSPGASAPNCTDFIDCNAAVGNAAAGSPAAGTPRALLCNETLDCVRDSGCAAGGKAPISCYCGTASGPDCQAGLGNGVCKPQIERSLETTSFSQVAARIGDVTFGGGVAMGRIDCDQTFCTAQCGL